MWGLGGQNPVEVSLWTRIVLLPDIRCSAVCAINRCLEGMVDDRLVLWWDQVEASLWPPNAVPAACETSRAYHGAFRQKRHAYGRHT